MIILSKLKTMKLLCLFVLSIVVLGEQIEGVTASASDEVPLFESSSCMFEMPNGAEEGVDVICGYVTVPEEHDNPDGPKIQLAIAIIKSKSSNPKPDPLFMAQGGPGGSTIDTYAKRLLTDSRLRTDRDIVLFDQRGTLYSKPNLMCKEIDQLILDTIEKDLTDAESEALDQEAMSACHMRLTKQGINLSIYNSLENASDIYSVWQALGYDQINLYGVSYGTLLALHTMREYPEILRSVILDGVVPPQTNFILESAKSQDRSFHLMFESCKKDPSCSKAYPDLENVFYQVVGDLNINPAEVPMKDPDSNNSYNAVIDGDSFLKGLFQMLYVSDLIPALPHMIYDALEGRFDFFGRIMSILVFDRTMSYGMYYSVLCAEDSDFDPADQDLNGVHPEIARTESRSPSEFLAICKLWNVEPLSPNVDQPVTSIIPTLILSGNFDPITPPIYGEIVESSLNNSYSYTIPTGGHGQAFEGECQDNIILSFLEDPTITPNDICVEKMNPLIFFTPNNLIDVPKLVSILNLEENSGIEMIILLVCLFILSSAILILPIHWVTTRLRATRLASSQNLGGILEPKRSKESLEPSKPFLIQTYHWVAILASVTLLTFIIGLTVVLVEMVMANDNRLFFGITSMARGWLILPTIFLLLTMIMILTSLIAWIKKLWSIWMRFYYSILTIAALSSLVILGKWGFLATIF